MAKKIILLAAIMLSLGTVAASDAAPEEGMIQTIQNGASNAFNKVVSTRKGTAWKVTSYSIAALSLIWQAIVAHRDVCLEEADRGIVEDVEKTSDSFLRMKVFKKLGQNYIRGLMLKSRQFKIEKPGQDPVCENATSGNKLNSLAAWLFTACAVDRVASLLEGTENERPGDAIESSPF